MIGRSLFAMVLFAVKAVCAAGFAWGEPMTATGVIAAIDSDNRRFSLDGGQTFVAGPKVKLSTRRIGEEVVVRYKTFSEELIALSVKRMPIALQLPIVFPGRNQR